MPKVQWYRHFFEAQNHPLGYFAALYAKVSASMEHAMADGRFHNPELFKKMDRYFAARYLQAMDAYLHGKETTEVWKVAIVAAEVDRIPVLFHLLAALNAHVNLDLPMASADAAPGTEIHNFHQDFHTVNEILFGLMETIQNDLAEVFWPLRWWNRIMGRFDDRILRVGLFKARGLAWRQAVQLAEAGEKESVRLSSQLDQRFTEVAQRLVRPTRWWVRLSLRWMRARENGSVADKIARLWD